jgi:hypothetical protein
MILCLAGYPVVNDPLYNHTVFGPEKGRGGNIGKTDEELIQDLINIHNAENWLGMDGDSELSMFKSLKGDMDDGLNPLSGKGKTMFVGLRQCPIYYNTIVLDTSHCGQC